MSRPRPTAIDLFAGAGGMSLGLEQAGFDVLAAVEWDPVHAAAHRYNFPESAVIEQDISSVTSETVRSALKSGARQHGRRAPSCIDLVAGGPPCQGFSVGGLLDPHDPRNLLVGEFVRLVAELQPRAFLLENVPAMATRRRQQAGDLVVEWVCSQLEEAGYVIGGPYIVNASWYGVPQDRRRLFVGGVLGGPAMGLPTPDVIWRARRRGSLARPGPPEWNPSDDRPLGPTVGEALEGLPNLDDFPPLLTSDSTRLDAAIVASLQIRSGYAAHLAGRRIPAWDLSRQRKWSRNVLTSSLRTTHTDDVVKRFNSVLQGGVDAISRFERLDSTGLAPTLRAGSTPDRGSYSAPRPIHPDHDRVISVREAARLHGFPDWFRLTAAKWHGFRQVGNAVCPPVARRFGQTLAGILDRAPSGRPAATLALGDASLLAVANGIGKRTPGRRAMAAGTIIPREIPADVAS
jgi:DNA (cytosine-5)-methyltransferase 1